MRPPTTTGAGVPVSGAGVPISGPTTGPTASSIGGVGTPRPRWIVAVPALQSLQTVATDATLKAWFGDQRTLILGQSSADIPVGWQSRLMRSFSGIASLQGAFSAGLGPSVGAVMYDNEAWQFTPLREQADPATYVAAAGTLVHQHALQFVSAPAVNLVKVIQPGFTGAVYDAYIQLNLAAISARSADVYVIQAQGSENNTALFSTFVHQAAAQARAANPHVIVLVGISTGPSGITTTAAQILAAARATQDAVDGYWLNIPRRSPACPNCTVARPDIAVAFLQLLGA